MFWTLPAQAGGGATSVPASKEGRSDSHLERLLSNQACWGDPKIISSKIEFWKWKQNLCQKCEECESSFFWRDFEHGCEVSQVGKRWMAGTILRIFSPKLVNLFLQEHSSLAVLVFRLLNAMGRRVSSRLQPSWGRSRWTSWPRAPWTSTSTTWSTTSSTMLWTSPLGWRRSWEWWMRKRLRRRTCTCNFLHRCQNFFRIFFFVHIFATMRIIFTFVRSWLTDCSWGEPHSPTCYKELLQEPTSGLFVQTFAMMYNFWTNFKIRSGPLEQLRRLGKLFSEEYADDLEKVVSLYFNLCIHTCQ